jgi:hypothetical protein
MAAREILLDWLRTGAARLRAQRRLDDVVRVTLWLAVLLLLNTLVAHFSPHPAPAIAFGVLSLPIAFALLAWLGWRLRWRPSLGQAAAAADARESLADTLVSAHWFADGAQADPFVDLHLRRAAETAQGLDVVRAFPLRLPRAGAAAAVVLVLAAAGVTLLPAPGASVRSDSNGGLPSAASAQRARLTDAAGARGAQTRELDGGGAQADTRSVAGSDVERDVAAPAAPSEAAPGSAGAGRPPQGTQRAGDSTGGSGAPSESAGDQMNQTMATSILERLAQLMSSDASEADEARGGQAQAATPTGDLERSLRREQQDAQPNATRENKAGEDALNTSLRALSRTGTSGRDMVRGEANTTEGGTAQAGEGALGRRIGQSSAGAGEGDQPVGALVPPQADDNVLGRRTERLEVQLRRGARIQSEEPPEGADSQADPEQAFYAATRAQAARAAFRPVESSARTGAQTPGEARQLPLELRDAMKRYTLARHRREPAPEQPDAAPR